jgi:hypothetical protein
MSVSQIKIGTVDISFDNGFEKQGFAVTEVTGLSDYGEHKMGVPGSAEVVITGIILPGADPASIRSYIYGSIDPYKPFMLQVYHRGSTSPIQTMGRIKSIKSDINSTPTSISVTILRYGGWYTEPLIKELTSNSIDDFIDGIFEFRAPLIVDIELLSYFSIADLNKFSLRIIIEEISYIQVDFKNIIPTIIHKNFTGLNEGSIIRIDLSLEHHVSLIVSGRIYDLPVLGKVVYGMIPPSIKPRVRLIIEKETIPDKNIGVVLKARQTQLTI